jgi:hypothetical protein
MKLFKPQETLKLIAVMSILGLATSAVQAESNFVTGTVAVAPSAAAKLDFRVTIPRVLYLRVGTGTDYANNTAVDLIDFAPTAAALGNGTAVAATAASGDLTNGAVTVRVYGNNGNITLNSANTGPLNNGVATQTIPWSQITVTPAALAATTVGYTNTAITHPAFSAAAAGGSGTATTLTATNNVVRQEGKWTFAYANTGLPGAGTYGGVNVNAGRVTYTASMP